MSATELRLKAAIKSAAANGISADALQSLKEGSRQYLTEVYHETGGSLADGRPIQIPVVISAALIRPGRLESDEERHAAAVAHVRQVNRAILYGVATSVLAAAGGYMSGGGLAAILPAASAILDALEQV